MTLLGRGRLGGSIEVVVTVAVDTPWERQFDYGVVSYAPPGRNWFNRFAWWWGRPKRRRARALIEQEVEAYRKKIISEGYVAPSG